jgi:glycosyltransferase involved in cell wall biosynthesis
MADARQGAQWIRGLELQENAHLLPKLSTYEMAALYRRAWMVVSPSEHDGTPNSFLEAIACGCYPIVGDLESLREWIEPGQNGELIDPGDADQLAQVVSAVIEAPSRRAQAQSINQVLIDERAARKIVTASAESFYEGVLQDLN